MTQIIPIYMKDNGLSINYLGALLLIGFLISSFFASETYGQNTGCVAGRFGVDAGLYSGVIEFGDGIEPVSPRSNDWFQGAFGLGIIDESNVSELLSLLQAPGNPTFIRRMKEEKLSVINGQIFIDAIFARDHFGGTGETDPTSYTTASKNGEDPAIWSPGTANVLGKNDIVDVGGFMFRDGLDLTSDLWFVGLFNMAEPGGVSYMDFEFFVQGLSLIEKPGGGIMFTSGGPDLGHTAYNFDGPGNITKVGDFIFSVSLLSGGPAVETRLWVSRAEWLRLGGNVQATLPTFKWAGTFDGAYNGSPFGYAGILPIMTNQFCGYVNQGGEIPLAPPWGTKNTKTNTWGTTYQAYSIAEVGINLTSFGMDHASLSGTDPCFFPLNTYIVKTRASASFTAQLKDFAGPFSWGQPTFNTVVSPEVLSCNATTATITASPERDDAVYIWSTTNGNIVSGQGTSIIVVDKPGTYVLDVTLPYECSAQTVYATVNQDPTFPFFNGPPIFSFTVPCNGNDGTLTATASGATKPYTFYLYDNNDVLITQETKGINDSSHTFTGLTAGTYRVDVKGTADCIITTGPVVIPARTPVDYDASLTHVTCFGFTDGKIELGTLSGKSPFTYLWSTGNTSKDLLNVGAGSYTVYITDADGCVTEDSFNITQPTEITGYITKTDDPGNAGNGESEVFPTGGTAPYTYLWTKTGDPAYVFTPNANAKKVTGLSYGEYTVVVTDAAGCFKSFTVFIYEKEICYDGIDNSGNGLTDCDDPGCPVPPPVFLPEDHPCIGESVIYAAQKPTMPDGVDASQYTFEWSFPANVVITAGDPTQDAAITLYWTNTSGGQVCVRGVINWPGGFVCKSTNVCFIIEVDDVPPAPIDIQFNNY